MLKKYQRQSLFFLVTYLLLISIAVRMQQEYFSPTDKNLIFSALAVYFVVATLEPLLAGIHKMLIHVYLAAQILITLYLVIGTINSFDYFAVLFLPLCYKIVRDLPQKTAFRWIGVIFLCILAGQTESYGWPLGIGFASAYIAIGLFTTALAIATNRAEQAQQKSQVLLAELQEANQKLQAYALQVEELAAAQERNRLARELHDFATQTVFSMVLTAQSARILLERDTARAAKVLDHLQELAQNALAEMRSLIQQLRPKPITADGLEAALRKHFAERQVKEGLLVDFQVEGSRRLPDEAEEALFRVVQEALNNVCKHAGTGQAFVRLRLNDPVRVCIEDHGCGFEPQAIDTKSQHVGLASMTERIQALGGVLVIEFKTRAGHTDFCG